ncbi:hypothetical protein OF83DRAFT_896956 [Amylostereum chailletii]|nr:hypothetical protein OF83DRAFT_896956 [Amylostereum chailletii]
MRVLLTGATGAAGLGVLRALLADDTVNHVTVLARRPLPSWVILPNGTTPTAPSEPPTHPKLSTTVLPSFLSYTPDLRADIAAHDACIWALGKSAVGMSEKDYTEMTVGYLDAFLDAAKEAGVGTAGGKPFRMAFITGQGTDPTEKSWQLFARVKGRAENHLTQHAKDSAGAFKPTILRPAYFFPSSLYPADQENTRPTAGRVFDKVLGNPLRYVMGITVEDMGKFAVEAVKGTWEAKYPDKVVFSNGEMKNAVKEVGTKGRDEL